MAIQNDSRVFTGGNVVLDSSPSVAMYNQLMMRRQAREEALNQYFTNLEKNINTAGVRMQDLQSEAGGINDDVARWRQNWLQNKDDIKRGGMAQQQHMALYQEVLRKIAQSKNRAKTELEIGKAKFEGKYDPDDDDLNVLDKIGRSIYDPNGYKPDGVSEYGWQDLSPNIPAFDANRQNQFWAAATKNVLPGKNYSFENLRTDAKTGKAIVPFTEAFGKDQVKRIADEAYDLVAGDKSAKKYYQKILDNPTSDDWERLNKAYQSVYGSDQFVMTPQQAAQADMILRASVPQKQSEEVMTDQNAAYNMWLRKQRAQDSFIRGRQRSGGGSGIDGNQFDVIDLSKYGNPRDGQVTITREDIPESVKAILKSANYDLSKDRFFDVEIVDGRIESIRPTGGSGKQPRGVISRVDMGNAQLKYDTEPQKSQRPTFGEGTKKKEVPNSSYKIKGKTYTQKQLLDMGYSIDDIAPYKQ
jgi:hypothetical protein